MTSSQYARCFGTITLSAILALLFGSLVLSGNGDYSGTFTFVAVLTVLCCVASAALGVVALAIADKRHQANARIRQAGWLLVAGLVLTAYEVVIR